MIKNFLKLTHTIYYLQKSEKNKKTDTFDNTELLKLKKEIIINKKNKY